MVSWGTALVFKPPIQDPIDHNSLWTLIAKPTNVIGNSDSVSQINSWFEIRSLDKKLGGILFVQGPCGVGKTLAVELATKSHGFKIINAFASESRTLPKLESHVRQCTAFEGMAVVVLDEFETFGNDRTGFDVVTRFINLFLQRPTAFDRVLLVCISSDIDADSDSFARIIEKTTFVRFDLLSAQETHSILKRANRACPTEVAAMDLYLFSVIVAGDARRAVNQFQFTFGHTHFEAPKKRKRSSKVIAVIAQPKRSFPSYSASNACVRPDVLARRVCHGTLALRSAQEMIDTMGHDALTLFVKSLQKEYPKSFSMESCTKMAEVSSDADIMEMDLDIDALDLSDSTVEDAGNFSLIPSQFQVGTACYLAGQAAQSAHGTDSRQESAAPKKSATPKYPKFVKKLFRDFEDRKTTEDHLLFYNAETSREDYIYFENLINKKRSRVAKTK